MVGTTPVSDKEKEKEVAALRWILRMAFYAAWFSVGSLVDCPEIFDMDSPTSSTASSASAFHNLSDPTVGSTFVSPEIANALGRIETVRGRAMAASYCFVT